MFKTFESRRVLKLNRFQPLGSLIIEWKVKFKRSLTSCLSNLQNTRIINLICNLSKSMLLKVRNLNEKFNQHRPTLIIMSQNFLMQLREVWTLEILVKSTKILTLSNHSLTDFETLIYLVFVMDMGFMERKSLRWSKHTSLVILKEIFLI